MMAEEIRRVVYQKPFRAFRVKLLNGEFIEINRTLRTTVSEDRVFFGVDEDPATGLAKRLRIVSLTQISAVEVASSA